MMLARGASQITLRADWARRIKMSNKEWWQRFLEGVRMSEGWFWIAVCIVLNVFTTVSIVMAITDTSGAGFKIVAAVTGISLVLLLVFVFLQAPYKGQKAGTERVLDERNGVIAELRRVIESTTRDYHEERKKVEELEQETRNR